VEVIRQHPRRRVLIRPQVFGRVRREDLRAAIDFLKGWIERLNRLVERLCGTIRRQGRSRVKVPKEGIVYENLCMSSPYFASTIVRSCTNDPAMSLTTYTPLGVLTAFHVTAWRLAAIGPSTRRATSRPRRS